LRGVRELAETSLLNNAEAGSWLWAAFGRMARRSVNNKKCLQRRRNTSIAAVRHDLPYALLGRFLPRLKAAVATRRPPFFCVV
jgi:hypothetical protein